FLVLVLALFLRCHPVIASRPSVYELSTATRDAVNAPDRFPNTRSPPVQTRTPSLQSTREAAKVDSSFTDRRALAVQTPTPPPGTSHTPARPVSPPVAPSPVAESDPDYDEDYYSEDNGLDKSGPEDVVWVGNISPGSNTSPLPDDKMLLNRNKRSTTSGVSTTGSDNVLAALRLKVLFPSGAQGKSKKGKQVVRIYFDVRKIVGNETCRDCLVSCAFLSSRLNAFFFREPFFPGQLDQWMIPCDTRRVRLTDVKDGYHRFDVVAQEKSGQASGWGILDFVVGAPGVVEAGSVAAAPMIPSMTYTKITQQSNRSHVTVRFNRPCPAFRCNARFCSV
ncbi:unnamed protein product, partial [Closterium sp. NIES-53]